MSLPRLLSDRVQYHFGLSWLSAMVLDLGNPGPKVAARARNTAAKPLLAQSLFPWTIGQLVYCVVQQVLAFEHKETFI